MPTDKIDFNQILQNDLARLNRAKTRRARAEQAYSSLAEKCSNDELQLAKTGLEHTLKAVDAEIKEIYASIGETFVETGYKIITPQQ